jgi:hypothetical protein
MLSPSEFACGGAVADFMSDHLDRSRHRVEDAMDSLPTEVETDGTTGIQLTGHPVHELLEAIGGLRVSRRVGGTD